VPGDIDDFDRLNQMSAREQLQCCLQVVCLSLRLVDSNLLENTTMGTLHANIFTIVLTIFCQPWQLEGDLGCTICIFPSSSQGRSRASFTFTFIFGVLSGRHWMLRNVKQVAVRFYKLYKSLGALRQCWNGMEFIKTMFQETEIKIKGVFCM